jgi:hypothetical protein
MRHIVLCALESAGLPTEGGGTHELLDARAVLGKPIL